MIVTEEIMADALSCYLFKGQYLFFSKGYVSFLMQKEKEGIKSAILKRYHPLKRRDTTLLKGEPFESRTLLKRRDTTLLKG